MAAGGILATFGAVVLRTRRLWVAAYLSIVLIPVLTDPSCYYYSVFLLAVPLCAARSELALVLVVLAGAGQLLAVRFGWTDDQFVALSALSLACSVALLIKSTCTTRAERPCGFNNCCGVQPDACPVQIVSAEPPQSCQREVRAGSQTACGFVAEGGASVFSACCPVNRPFGCPGGGCFASSEQARAVCPSSCVECAATPQPDAIGLGKLCTRPGDPACPAGSDCILRPSVPPATVGFCSPPCSAFASTPQCQWASAPPGIRTGCAGPGDGYLAEHCYLIDDGCASSCPPGFNCQTGGCFPD